MVSQPCPNLAVSKIAMNLSPVTIENAEEPMLEMPNG